jgi:hypothetical protein
LLVNFAMRLPLIMKREHQLKQQEFRKVHWDWRWDFWTFIMNFDKCVIYV